MGRSLVTKGVGSAISEADIKQRHKCSGPIFMLGMIVISVSIISLIMFGCADGAGKPRKVDKPQKIKEKCRKSSNRGGVYDGGMPAAAVYASACGGSSTAGGGGCACGGGGGGGCGGAGGGGYDGGGGGGC